MKPLIPTVLLTLAALGLGSAAALHQGLLWFNNPSLTALPVQGLDVSHHQGPIDWPAVAAAERHRFVWIKATEGGDWLDTRFEENWRGAREAGLTVGAYHFFTFCRPAVDQAAHFIATVPAEPGTLPPAIDLEFGGNCSARPGRAELLAEVAVFGRALQAHYGVPPIIYATYPFVEKYLQDALPEYPLWIRDIYKAPEVAHGRPWIVWQFSSRGRVPGIDTFVDENAFAHTPADFQVLLTR